MAAAIKPIYTATSAEAAEAELDAFEQGMWGQKFPRRGHLAEGMDRVIPFFVFPRLLLKIRGRQLMCSHDVPRFGNGLQLRLLS